MGSLLSAFAHRQGGANISRAKRISRAEGAYHVPQAHITAAAGGTPALLREEGMHGKAVRGGAYV